MKALCCAVAAAVVAAAVGTGTDCAYYFLPSPIQAGVAAVAMSIWGVAVAVLVAVGVVDLWKGRVIL